jgi:hypothetical protein
MGQGHSVAAAASFAGFTHLAREEVQLLFGFLD